MKVIVVYESYNMRDCFFEAISAKSCKPLLYDVINGVIIWSYLPVSYVLILLNSFTPYINVLYTLGQSFEGLVESLNLLFLQIYSLYKSI